MAIARAAVDSIQSETRAVRRLLIDSLLGTPTWLQFAPDQLRRRGHASTPDAVVRAFLSRRGVALFDVGPRGSELREVQRSGQGSAMHLRFHQYWNGMRVVGGELRLHLRQTGGSWSLETVNGSVFPDIDAPVAAVLSPEEAAQRVSASSPELRDVRRDSASAPVVVAAFDRYRVAHVLRGRRSSGAPIRVVVDATTGSLIQVLDDFQTGTFAGDSSGAGSAGHVAGSERMGPTRYVSGSGVDALNHPRDFSVAQNATGAFELRDNSLSPTVTEVSVHDLGGVSIHTEAACLYAPVVSSQTPSWPQTSAGKEEVSAVANAIQTGAYYQTHFSRSSWDRQGAPVRLCVHGTDYGYYGEQFNAVSFASNNRLAFVRQGPGFLPSAAPQDVVTHEFTHNVSRNEEVANWSGYYGYETRAVSEALSDYFGSRHRGSSCLGGDAYGGIHCVRNTEDFLTYSQGQDSVYHKFGIVFVGALWQTAKISSAFGEDVDQAVYEGMQYYMLNAANMLNSREAVIRAAMDRLHDNTSTTNPVPLLEQEFSLRGVGWGPVQLSLAQQCDVWQVTVGTGGLVRPFGIVFESGSGQNVDQSVGYVDYTQSVLSWGWRSGDTYSFSPGDLGHRLNDGHSHAFRVYFTDVANGLVGFLNYYVGSPASDYCEEVPIEGRRQHRFAAAAAPAEFALRQSVSRGANEPVAAARLGADRQTEYPSLAARVAAVGIRSVEYDVPATGAGQRITIAVYDMRGTRMRTLVDERAEAGRKVATWDGATDAGGQAAPGVYVAVMTAGGRAFRSRLVIAR